MTSRTCALALLALGVALARLAYADPDPTDPASRPPLRSAGAEGPTGPKDLLFDGNHIGMLGGVVLPKLDLALPGVAQWGAGARVAGRFATVTQVADVEVGLEWAQWSGAGSAGVAAGTASRAELGGQLAIHPGFPFLVFNDWIYDVLSGIHGFCGASVVRANVSGAPAVAATRQTGESSVDWRPALTCGSGVDIPVSPRNQHSGWWLTVRYALRWTRFGDAVPDHNFSDNQIAVLLGWRSYDNGWARMPRPF